MEETPDGEEGIDRDVKDAARQENPKEKHRKFSSKKWDELVANAAWLLEHGTEREYLEAIRRLGFADGTPKFLKAAKLFHERRGD